MHLKVLSSEITQMHASRLHLAFPTAFGDAEAFTHLLPMRGLRLARSAAVAFCSVVRGGVINAQYALPFNPPRDIRPNVCVSHRFPQVWRHRNGAVFGPNDEWSGNAKLTFVTRERAQQHLQDCEIISFQEVEGTDRLAVGGQKYWHTFHFIARKK